MKIQTLSLKTLIPALVLVAAGCASTSDTVSTAIDETSTLASSTVNDSDLNARADALLAREAELARKEADLETSRANLASSSSSASMGGGSGDLFPPSANPGECYARVFVEPTYRTVSTEVLVKEEGIDIQVIPAQYETVEETVEITSASYTIENIPAQYETVSEQLLVQQEELSWKIDLAKGAAPASQDLLETAKRYGIDVASASPGQCFHEHYIPEQYETVQESVLVEEAYDVVDVTPAEYNYQEKQVLVQDASSRIIEVPAQYETVTEQILDKPAHTTWKKGAGPIQKIDSATGEIMCLVEIPATYKTISKRILVSPATTRVEEIPAQYKTVKVKEVANSAREERRTIPAKYDTVSRTQKSSEASFTWHPIENNDHPSSTRTGKKICLTQQPAKYKTVTRRVVSVPASTRQIEIPAQYDTIKVTKEVQPAQEVRNTIPAEFRTVTSREVEQEGFMEWRSILCDTNMTRGNIQRIQQALKTQGYNPGSIDGVIGNATIEAMNQFQADNNIPTDKYLNMQTIEALGVSI